MLLQMLYTFPLLLWRQMLLARLLLLLLLLLLFLLFQQLRALQDALRTAQHSRDGVLHSISVCEVRQRSQHATLEGIFELAPVDSVAGGPQPLQHTKRGCEGMGRPLLLLRRRERWLHGLLLLLLLVLLLLSCRLWRRLHGLLDLLLLLNCSCRHLHEQLLLLGSKMDAVGLHGNWLQACHVQRLLLHDLSLLLG